MFEKKNLRSRLVLTMTRNRTRDKVDVFLEKSKEMSKAGSETSEGGRTDTESNIQHIDSTWT
ncbi:hypothetical protein YC2023_099696 [Brassica napus]